MKSWKYRVLSILLVTMLVFASVKPMEVKATGLSSLPVAIGSAGAAGAGVTLGGAIAILLSVVAVGYGVYLTVDNWDDLTAGFKTYMDANSNGNILTFIKDLGAVSIADGITKLSDVITAGQAWNIKDYYIPDNAGKKMAINDTTQSYVKQFLMSRYKYADLKPGSYGSLETEINKLISGENVTMVNNGYLNMKYIAVVTDSSSDYIAIIASNNLPYHLYTYNNTWGDTKSFLIANDIMVYTAYRSVSTGWNTYESYNAYPTGGYQYYGRTGWSTQTIDIRFCNYDVKAQNGTLWKAKTFNAYTIDKSKMMMDKDTSTVSTITFNRYLTDELSKVINIDNLGNMDKVAEVVMNADNIAESNYADVTNTDIDYAEGVHDVSDIGEWIVDLPAKILDSIKSALQWLFVPAEGVLEEKTAELTEKVNSQMGILSYPVALVIKFLMGVSELNVTDCILRIPKIEFKGQVFYPGVDYNLSASLREPQFATIYSYYKLITNFILIIAVVNLAVKKGDEIIRGN